ncbi:unnamed protein product [Linum tenue]|uniref:BHLH domain-containing protein n=1 Tax=Linum tenue TaxID=586396 RepID=A0AAV0J663_9ROSI|nr:unnamed protein product [Linum tenue]
MELPPTKMETEDPAGLGDYDSYQMQNQFVYSSGDHFSFDSLFMHERCSINGHTEQNNMINPDNVSTVNYASTATGSFGRPPEQRNPTELPTWDHSAASLKPSHSPPPSSSRIISFGNSLSPPTRPAVKSETAADYRTEDGVMAEFDDYYPYLNSDAALDGETKRAAGGSSSSSSSRSRSVAHAQDHVIAERKRREKLSQRFIALSALVPGLKKMDKASVLGDATKYLQHLQERVKSLEEQTAGKEAMESVLFVKKSQVHVEDEYSSSSSAGRPSSNHESPLPEIEARVSDGHVLIRIHCERQKGSLSKVLAEIEKHRLNVVNSTVLPFGSSILDITLVAHQMDGSDSATTMRDLVKSLHRVVR